MEKGPSSSPQRKEKRKVKRKGGEMTFYNESVDGACKRVKEAEKLTKEMVRI